MRCTVFVSGFVSGFVSVFVYGFVYVFVCGFVSELYRAAVSAPEEYLHPAIFAAFGSSALTSWIYLILPNDISKIKAGNCQFIIEFLYLISV